MNRLKSQRLKRARRQALHEARHANKTTPLNALGDGEVTIHVIHPGNVYRRKWMKKRDALRSDIISTWRGAMNAIPVDDEGRAKWTESIAINLAPGVYAVDETHR